MTHHVRPCGHPSHGACCTACGEWRVPEHNKTCATLTLKQDYVQDGTGG